MATRKLLLIVPYFGRPVRWLDFFLASCARNPRVDWLLVTDFAIPNRPANVLHREIALPAYLEFVRRKLELGLPWTHAYKLCDLKPALGYLHHDVARDYEFWGYSDMDLVYGDLLGPYEPLMDEFDIISSHTYLLAGHLAVYRTMEETLTLFSRHPAWREKFAKAENVHFDEKYMTSMLMPPVRPSTLRFAERLVATPEIGGRTLKVLFKEQYTTFMGEDWLLPGGRLAQPAVWTWDHGVVTNDVMQRSVLYAHFSHWNSGRWGNTEGPDAGAWNAAGEQAFPKRPYGEIGKFTVSREGFRILE